MDAMYNPEVIAPSPRYPERGTPTYERKFAQNVERRGPLRFQEGIATDTDVPADFVVGIQQGMAGPRGRNQKIDTKWPQETMAQRAHVGSAAWVEAPPLLGEFAHGSFGDHGAVQYERVVRPYQRVPSWNPAVVLD